MCVDRKFEFQFGRGLNLFALEVGDSFANHAQVKVEPDAGDVARLFAAEQVSGTSNFEVLHRDLHSATKFVVLSDGSEAVVCGLGERLIRGIEEVGVGAFTTAANATANLVQLTQTEVLGAVDDQSVGVWNVDSGFDDGGRNQHVKFLLPEVNDNLLERRLRHLTVSYRNAGFGNELCQLMRNRLD